MLERLPVPVFLGAGHALGDEEHPLHAVRDVRIKALAAVELLAARAPADVGIGGLVDVGESLEERLGVPGRQAARTLSRRPEIAGVRVARIGAVRSAGGPPQQLVWLLLVPLQRALGAVDL